MPLPLARNATVEQSSHRCALPIAAPAILRCWHLLSLDAPTVAVAWTLSFARAADVHLPLWVPALIAMGTWWVYVADRIIDAWRALGSDKAETLRDRHFFHWRHRRILVPIASAAAVASALIVFQRMPVTVREHDSLLALAALVYFSGLHAPGAPGKRWFSRLWSKELVVGVLFTAGCALPTVTQLHGVADDRVSVVLLLLAMAFYAGLAWLNCTAIDRWESGSTASAGRPALWIGVGAVLLGLASAPIEPRVATLAMACSASGLLLALLDRARSQFTPLALRCAADLVLLTPILCLTR